MWGTNRAIYAMPMRVCAARFGMAVLAVSLALGLSASNAQADEAWVITSFHSEISIASNSSIAVTEDIRVDFGSLQKHGIFRTIPLLYRYDDSHDRYYLLDVKSVTDGSKAVTYSESIDHDNEVIKIGDAARLVSGKNRYRITYTVRGAM